MPAPAHVLRVALPTPLPRLFDYLPPGGMAADAVALGQRVQVPFGKRDVVGVVLGHGPAAEGMDLREALALPDPAPLLQGELLASLRWLAGYLHAPVGEVLATALPAALRRGEPLPETAAFGWRRSEAWGFEVRLPAGYDTSGASRKAKRPIAAWRADGVTLADGAPLPDSLPRAGLLVPARREGGGPAFLVGRNFDALFSYNASENYALAIAQLSNLVAAPAGTPIGFVQPWPTDDPGLSRAQNRELQALLLTRGHDIGSADGLIGARTREAIKTEQQRLGMEADGRAGQKLLAALRGG